MREIEYRAKSFVNDGWQWVYGYYAPVYLFEKDGEENHTYCIVSDKCIGRAEMLGCGVQSGLPAHYLIRQETLGQFTGLKDKNGVKVYEGDILARIYYDGKTRIEGVVKYGEFNCSCCDGVYGWYIDDGDIRDLADSNYTPLFVIGNIYDNPELIKESE